MKVSLEKFHWEYELQVTDFSLFSKKQKLTEGKNDTQSLVYRNFLQQSTIHFSSLQPISMPLRLCGFIIYTYLVLRYLCSACFFHKRLWKSFNNTALSFPFKFSLHLGKLLSERTLTFWDKNKPIVLYIFGKEPTFLISSFWIVVSYNSTLMIWIVKKIIAQICISFFFFFSHNSQIYWFIQRYFLLHVKH